MEEEVLYARLNGLVAEVAQIANRLHHVVLAVLADLLHAQIDS